MRRIAPLLLALALVYWVISFVWLKEQIRVIWNERDSYNRIFQETQLKLLNKNNQYKECTKRLNEV